MPIGLLTNHATFSGSGRPVACELLRQGFSVKKLFSPEHGIQSQGEDGKAQPSGIDSITQLPIISLYGKNMCPETSELNDVEIILIDLPNIGCRFYTYWWTISQMVEACAAAKKKVILLDRPNASRRKIQAMEGPLLDEKNCRSFLGRWSMPLTYAHSYGQLIQWFIYQRKISIDLSVIPFEPPTDTIFIPPSPSMNELQAVWAYPFTGLFEGINLNLGRGTSFPFRVLGAPWVNSMELFEAFRNQKFAGITAFPYSYQPVWSHYSNHFCHGLYFHVENVDTFRPVRTALWLMNYLSIHYHEYLLPEPYPTAANLTGENQLDLLLGMQNSYSTFCSGVEINESEIVELLDVDEWTRKVDEYLSNLPQFC